MGEYFVQNSTVTRLKFLFQGLNTRRRAGCFFLMFHDDEFVSVDLVKVSYVLLTEAFENLHLRVTKIMAPLTRSPKLTVTLEVVQAEVRLVAGSGELAGTVRTIAFVVMRADLQGNKGEVLLQQTCKTPLCRTWLFFLHSGNRHQPAQPTSGSRQGSFCSNSWNSCFCVKS